jgi:hypothetical protein
MEPKEPIPNMTKKDKFFAVHISADWKTNFLSEQQDLIRKKGLQILAK